MTGDNDLLATPFGIRTPMMSRDQIAELLNVSPEAYEAFEKAYRVHALSVVPRETHNLFDVSVKQLEREPTTIPADSRRTLESIIERTVDELLAQTVITKVRDGQVICDASSIFTEPALTALTPEDLQDVPKELRPQLLGEYSTVQTEPGGAVPALMFFYKMFLTASNPADRKFAYEKFRQGLDILDIEPLMYEMLKVDPNAMGKWLVPVTEASRHCRLLVPDTTLIQVPMTLLQMTRLDYEILNQTTRAIANRFCMKAFELDITKEYFIKTGTFSSKFDFRNARVQGEKEVREIGEYLIFLSNQAVEMATPMHEPCYYGVSTNNEWAVREYIQDVENNPCIYKGMPLHTEYRVFVDCDTDEVLGVADYWDRDLLKRRFNSAVDADSPHNIHDYIIVQKHSAVMDRRFAEGRDFVTSSVADMLPYLNLRGQWSLDVMQNGDRFFIIDMAPAATSALREKITPGKIKAVPDALMTAITGKIRDTIIQH